MTVWEYLKGFMAAYRNRTAFGGNETLTYSQLIELVETRAEGIKEKHRLIASCTQCKREQAIELLSILASGNAAVPMSKASNIIYPGPESAESSNTDKEPALIMYTSGTSGGQKGVMLSHKNIISNIDSIRDYFEVSPGERLLIVRPLSHASALVGELLAGLTLGLTFFFFEEQFSPKRLISCINKYKIQVLCATPTIFYHIAVSKDNANQSESPGCSTL